MGQLGGFDKGVITFNGVDCPLNPKLPPAVLPSTALNSSSRDRFIDLGVNLGAQDGLGLESNRCILAAVFSNATVGFTTGVEEGAAVAGLAIDLNSIRLGMGLCCEDGKGKGFIDAVASGFIEGVGVEPACQDPQGQGN